jgi:hypothetical protein
MSLCVFRERERTRRHHVIVCVEREDTPCHCVCVEREDTPCHCVCVERERKHHVIVYVRHDIVCVERKHTM